MLRGVTAGALHFRGLALRTFPFGILQPLPDGGLRHGLVTAAVVDNPVDHAIVVLNGYFSGTEGIVPFLHICVHHRKGPGAVAQAQPEWLCPDSISFLFFSGAFLIYFSRLSATAAVS